MNIQDVYHEATVLVTGATGFVGKGLIAKILTTCTGVRKVFVLIRSKRNLTAQQRLDNLKQDLVFDHLRSLNASALDKLCAVDADIACSPTMGMSENDEQMLLDEVDMVFHSAATISFNLPFDATSKLNIMGTKRMLDVCRRMKNLKSFVYVSTAYVGVFSEVLEEKLCSLKKPIDFDGLEYILSHGTTSEKLEEARKYQDDHPNTYTFSKLFAEHLADHYFRNYDMPICIVRPSAITNAYAEPAAGWASNLSGAIWLLTEPARGAVRCIVGKENALLDIIPIDFVCNLMLVAAWWTIQNRHEATDIRIYNHTTGNMQPLSFVCLCNAAVKYGRLYPSRYTVMYPKLRFTQNRLVYEYLKWVYQMIPCYILDLLARVRGQKQMFLSMALTFNKFMDISTFFLKTFKFRNDNVVALITASQQADDSSEFPMDIRVVNLEEYMQNMWLGVRRYVLNENLADSPVERAAKCSSFRVIDRIYQAAQVGILMGLLWIGFMFV